MLTEELDAASAAFAVGYESPSQFNREYKRFFGKTPDARCTSIAGVPVIVDLGIPSGSSAIQKP
jgi:AraC-like DNA-binding protein